jgi:catechol 2,3-dioxygenase-like lactoylglutathione lyase family enzyme
MVLDHMCFTGSEIDHSVAFFQFPKGMVIKLPDGETPRRGSVDTESYNVGDAHLYLQADDVRTLRPAEVHWGPSKGRRFCYLRDPDGISIQLPEVLTGRPEPHV